MIEDNGDPYNPASAAFIGNRACEAEAKAEAEVPAVWAIVELMGHVRLAGRLSEEEKFGSKMGRLDIPQGDDFITQFFGGGSVYRITIVTEAVARDVCKRTPPEPVRPWDYPKQIAAAPDFGDDDDGHDSDFD